jgi:hypothetical protein
VDVEPAGGAVKWSISGEKLGCAVDATGKVLIGSAAGTITVRAGDGTHYDEVSITITAPKPAAGAPAPSPTDAEPDQGGTGADDLPPS